MKTIFPWLVLALPVTAYQGTEWKSFSPKDAAFSILFPGPPTEQKNPVKTPSGTIDIYLCEVVTTEGKYVVSWSEFPADSIKPNTEDQRLNNARDAAVASAKGKLKREKALLLDKYPGRELVIEIEGKPTVLMRMYAVKNRLYQVVVVGSIDMVTSKEAAKFLDSFKLAK
jgi:hypothetical protein